MSDHKKPMPPELRDALANHRLPTDMPSQLADSFRHGWYAGRADAQAEIARLRGALEKCSTALYLAAPFADGCNVEDALTIEIGRAAAPDALK